MNQLHIENFSYLYTLKLINLFASTEHWTWKGDVDSYIKHTSSRLFFLSQIQCDGSRRQYTRHCLSVPYILSAIVSFGSHSNGSDFTSQIMPSSCLQKEDIQAFEKKLLEGLISGLTQSGLATFSVELRYVMEPKKIFP